MEYREGLELEKQCVEERFKAEKAKTVAELEDLLARVKRSDPRWVNVYNERVRNNVLNALENLSRAAGMVEYTDMLIKTFDEKPKTPPKPQNQLAFGAPTETPGTAAVASAIDWGNVEQAIKEQESQ